jgi:hypothetical protein
MLINIIIIQITATILMGVMFVIMTLRQDLFFNVIKELNNTLLDNKKDMVRLQSHMHSYEKLYFRVFSRLGKLDNKVRSEKKDGKA